MEKERVIVIDDAGVYNDAVKEVLHDLAMEDVIVMSPERAKGLAYPQSEPFILENPYPLAAMQGREFVCKGKHQYRQSRYEQEGIFYVEWKCQCGKTI